MTTAEVISDEAQERSRPAPTLGVSAVRRGLLKLQGNRLLHAGFTSLADQALVSFSNFLTMVLLARALSPHEFGSFVVVYTALLFANSFQQSLITRPHNVFAAPMPEKMNEVYTGGAAGVQLLLASFFAAIPLAGAIVSHYTHIHITWMLVSLSAAMFCWQLQEFVRQVQFTNGRIGEVLRLDIISYGGQAVLIAGLWRAGVLDGPIALFVLAGTSLASAIYGFYRIRIGSLWRTLKPAWRSNWRFGKWLLADNMGSWLAIHIYPVAVAALVSAVAAGALRTAQNVVQPMYILVNAFQSLMLPRVSRAYAEGGRPAMFRLLAPATLVVFAMLFCYAALMGVFAKQVLALVYGHAYDDYAPLVWYCGLSYLFVHLTQAAGLALMVQGQTRSIFVSRMVVVPFTLTAGMWITWHFGLYGAAFASCVLASGAILAVQYAFLFRERRGRGTSKSDTSLVVTGGNAL